MTLKQGYYIICYIMGGMGGVGGGVRSNKGWVGWVGGFGESNKYFYNKIFTGSLQI